MSAPLPETFLRVLADLAACCENAGVPAMIIGGVAASILGRPRATRDIDALAIAPEENWESLLSSARQHGMEPRIEQPLEFAQRTRVLLLRHLASGIDIDIILGRLPFEEEAIAHSELRTFGGVPIRLPRVEDLLILKAVAQRPQDLRDIEGLLDTHPEVDLERVRQWLRAFATALTRSDLIDEFESLVAHHRSPRR